MKHECHMKTKLILKHETLSCGTIKCNVRCTARSASVHVLQWAVSGYVAVCVLIAVRSGR